MRDDSLNWEAPTGAGAAGMTGPALVLSGVEISPLTLPRLMLVSGAGARAATALPLTGWPDPAPEGPHAVVLRRDRILEIGGVSRRPGWDGAAGLAVSDVSDGWLAMRVSGPKALEVLQRGAELSPAEPSASAARQLFGLPAILFALEAGGYAVLFRRSQAMAGASALRMAAGLATAA